MSPSVSALPANGTWALWKSQTLSIVWMELKKNFVTKRGFWIYLLAAAPPVIVWMHSLITMRHAPNHDLPKDVMILAGLFQFFLLRPCVFFGCLGIFTYLFRGEFVERSLHYYFLAPARREVLLIAKFIAGAVTAICFFGGSVILTFVGMYAHYPQFQVREWFFNGPGLSHFTAYVGITILACLGWGSIFIWMGIRFRNPILPAILFLGWESLNVLMPRYLRRTSVLHYLQSLNPVQVEASGPGAMFGTTAEPEKAIVAILGILAFTAVMIFLSIRQLKRTEISYSTD